MDPKKFDQYIKWGDKKYHPKQLDNFHIAEGWATGEIRFAGETESLTDLEVRWTDGVTNQWVAGVKSYDEAEAVVRWLGACYEALEQDLEQPDDPEFINWIE
jgi:hypothetical protein